MSFQPFIQGNAAQVGAPKTGGGGPTSYSLTLSGGTLTVTGQTATLSRNRSLSLAGGTLTVTGQSATVAHGKSLSLANGTLTVTGGAATLSRNRSLSLAGGTLTVTGQSSTLNHGRSLSLVGGTLTVNGGDATLTKAGASGTAYSLSISGGTLTVTGGDASLEKSVVTSASGGGIGHGKKKKRIDHVWMEEDGKILVFRNATDASQYVADKKPKNPAAPPKTVTLKKVKPEVINIDVLKGYQERLSVALNEPVSVVQAFNDHDIGLLLELARKVIEWQEEDDLEILLLAS